MKKNKIFGAIMGILMLGYFVTNAGADGITIFSTGSPTNLMATASRPESTGKIEIESADIRFRIAYQHNRGHLHGFALRTKRQHI